MHTFASYFVIKVVNTIFYNGKSLSFSLIVALALCSSCGGGKSDTQTVVATVDSADVDDFHADNDIAMTVCSIADALRVGEPLDTTDYNFMGVLTDGTGRPLYTNLKGEPGVWDVDVLSRTSVVIRNTEVGDLLPDDLERYITATMQLSAENLIDSLEYHGAEGAETSVYAFDGGFLRIDVRSTSAANGIEGSLVSITTSRDLVRPHRF